jgi:hypothetical protein
LIGAVFAWNVQCALVFLAAPGAYTAGFELSGTAGEAAVRGMGILFLMWNVPYALALWHPQKHRMALFEAVAMQAIGVAGESLLLAGLPAGAAILRDSVSRFITFDAAGLALLLAAVLLQRVSARP